MGVKIPSGYNRLSWRCYIGRGCLGSDVFEAMGSTTRIWWLDSVLFHALTAQSVTERGHLENREAIIRPMRNWMKASRGFCCPSTCNGFGSEYDFSYNVPIAYQIMIVPWREDVQKSSCAASLILSTSRNTLYRMSWCVCPQEFRNRKQPHHGVRPTRNLSHQTTRWNLEKKASVTVLESVLPETSIYILYINLVVIFLAWGRDL
jgi:hypothetical protein